MAFHLKFHQLVRQDTLYLSLFVLIALMSAGCPGSNDQVPGEDKGPKSTAQTPPAQETSENQTISPVPDKEENVLMADTAPSSTREEAQEQLTHAQESVGKAEQLLKRAPVGKGSDMALSDLQKELDSAHALLQTGQKQFQDQQFQLARTQAQEATKKADAVAQHIEQAINTATRQSP